MPPPAQSARPTSLFAASSLLSPLSATAPSSSCGSNSNSSSSPSPQHLEPPQQSGSAMNRLSLDSALMRKNPFARANASQLSISTESPSDHDIEPGLKSAPPVPDGQKRHSANFPLADRLLASFSSVSLSSSNDDPPMPTDAAAATGVGCEVSDDEMQALLEHVRRSENERARAEHELQRREKELARVKNELRKAEREIEELRNRLRRHEQHRGALDGTLNPEELGVLPPPTSRHDSLDPNHTRASSCSTTGAGAGPTAATSVPSPVGESPYYVSGEVYGASTSTMDLSPTTATATANATPSLRPLSCSAALPPRFGNGSSPRLQTQPSMTSISEAIPAAAAAASSSGSPVDQHEYSPSYPQATEENPYQYRPYQFPPPTTTTIPQAGEHYEHHQHQQHAADIAAAAAALEGNAPPIPGDDAAHGASKSGSGRRFLRSRHGKEKSASAPRPKSSYAGAGAPQEGGLKIKEKKSAGRLREKFSRMSLFGGKRDDAAAPAGGAGVPSEPVPAVPAMEA
ncbi:protein isoform a [Diplodia corticola]|uniref:Protein isoform a n=1 Tax=Diplodia corticola TaxID=236234 RepID=A0A1J9RRE2_9PEZI|nr:protein isoform a [Diplodia corticola]OJD30468.1 protein isoform a [Diplodia corticola]